jgi:hypothetical protein
VLGWAMIEKGVALPESTARKLFVVALKQNCVFISVILQQSTLL